MTKQWSKHKALLHRLYISEKHKLKYVMETMEGKHNFVASRRTYMKKFSRWGFRKNRKSPFRKEDRSPGGVNKQPPEAELDTCKIKDAGISHRTEVLIQGSTTTEVTAEPAVSRQATGGISSPLDEFRDSNDLFEYLRFIRGALLLNDIKKKALLSGNPDPHFPAMADYQQRLGKVFSGQDL